jgi:hypothetical protein
MSQHSCRRRDFLIAASTGVALGCVVLCRPDVAAAQRPEPKTETKSGTVVEVQKKGRARTLVVDDSTGQRHEFVITPKVVLEVTAPGDAGFVQAGQIFSARGTMSNQKVFVKELTIGVVPPRTRKVVAGKIEKAPAMTGQSTESYLVSGSIVGTQPDPDYKDYRLVGLNLRGAAPPIMLEPGFTVTVSSSDPDLIVAGAPVDLELAPLRGGKFTLVKAIVKLQEPLSSETLLGKGKPAADKSDKAPDSEPVDDAKPEKPAE